MTEDPWNKSHNGVDKCNRGNRAIREHIVADGNFKIDKVLDDAVIDPFVMTADDDEMRFLRKLRRHLLVESVSSR